LKEHRDDVYARLEAMSAAVADGLSAEAAKAGVPLTTNRIGAMFTWFFTPNRVIDFDSASTSDTAAFGRFHRAMLDQGIWLPPSQYEAVFLSTAHTMEDITATVKAATSAFTALAENRQ